MRAVEVRIFGRVQGVAFRASAQREADRLGLSGCARNEPDGSVTARVQGPESAVEQFIAWCHEGPPAARVTRVLVSDVAPLAQSGFQVR